MVGSSDGFKIANVDLKMRGPGNMMGTKQSGLLELRFVNLAEDYNIIKQTSINQGLVFFGSYATQQYSKYMPSFKNLKISNKIWKKKHIQSIKTAYGNSPFFIHYIDQIFEIINYTINEIWLAIEQFPI